RLAHLLFLPIRSRGDDRRGVVFLGFRPLRACGAFPAVGKSGYRWGGSGTTWGAARDYPRSGGAGGKRKARVREGWTRAFRVGTVHEPPRGRRLASPGLLVACFPGEVVQAGGHGAGVAAVGPAVVLQRQGE